jgi:hypothetical protein
MRGRRTITAMSMISKVFALLDASQTVRLSAGFVDDGIRNGNNPTPAVKIVAACVIPLVRSANPCNLNLSS